MTHTIQDLFPIVQFAVADALGIDEAEVVAEASLVDDLGAESIDMLDILFRIQRESGIKVSVSDMEALMRGPEGADLFDDDEIVTEAGLARLEMALPQFDRTQLSGPLTAEQLVGLFTVQNLVDMVLDRARAEES
ncbi:phosphopantetheine-binding protein [Nocardia sp. IBHARD005]|uniref:phosphopantetheine-binding protein n=1 Tax=Nocardia sp. IBHARD005 TaxID=3457765 RepID=UPI0040593B3F